ncbi:MAG: isoprenylcysteine carboxylmethyltransferase family protein [Cyclobacteriaceae bacterium]|nr:isoprenylcysteine carboxylmethyltransferase family protein [Cyclobacteriaceae bacterium]
MQYLWLSVLWISYFIIHGVLAATAVKNRFKAMNISPVRYRLVYNIIALLLLLPIIFYSSAVESEYVFVPGKMTKFAGLLAAGWGIVIARAAFKSYDTKAFLGLHSLEKENEFATSGLLKYVRHPLYAGSILFVIGYFLYTPKLSSLISSSLIIVYFLVGIHFEEKKLISQFGQAYLDFKKSTPMLIPRFSKRQKKSPESQ